MKRYWFKPKQYGYGATPVTWEGWAVTAAFGLIIAGVSIWRMQSTVPVGEDWFYWLAAVVTATAAIIAISYWKTDREWRWQWGGADRNSGKE